MPTVADVLSNDKEVMPAWLRTAGPDFNSETVRDFFSSRVVYYPGAGQDGRAFALFGAAHSAHCFLHIDVLTPAEEIQDLLNSDKPTRFSGYTSSSKLISPQSLSRLFCLNLPPEIRFAPNRMSALWTILNRHPDFSDDHGPERLAFLHVQAEAVWFCSKIWEKFDKSIPFGVVLQDYSGYGWPTFGGTGDLNAVANRATFADYLLVAEYTEPWPQYERVSELTEKKYGMNGKRVTLYRKVHSPTE